MLFPLHLSRGWREGGGRERERERERERRGEREEIKCGRTTGAGAVQSSHKGVLGTQASWKGGRGREREREKEKKKN